MTVKKNWGKYRSQFRSSWFKHFGWNHARSSRFVRLDVFKLFLDTVSGKVNIRGTSYSIHCWHIFQVFIYKYTFVLFAKSLGFCEIRRANTVFPEVDVPVDLVRLAPLTIEELSVAAGLMLPMTSAKDLSRVSRTRLTVALRRRL